MSNPAIPEMSKNVRTMFAMMTATEKPQLAFEKAAQVLLSRAAKTTCIDDRTMEKAANMNRKGAPNCSRNWLVCQKRCW